MKTILFLFVFYISVNAQISPGDLSSVHSHLEGISNCTKCHEIGNQVSSKKCLSCHQEIQGLINAGRGFHSRMNIKKQDCRNCHNEHHGRNFKILKFDPENFNHKEAGYELTGAHIKIGCRDCHQAKYISDKSIAKKKNTYLGLSAECKSCHIDYHQGTLLKNCSDCHSTDAFRPASKFNHIQSDFKLTGAHISAACIKCHPKETKNGKDFQKFKGVAYIQCISCHKDVHAGKFGTNCQECHSTSSFHQVKTAAFDHNRTSYPLKGRHIRVECNDCHKSSVTAKIKHEQCMDCHQDYHKGEFSSGDKVKDCSLCHSENGFRPALFSIDDHQKLNYKLEGAHLAVPCQNCHYKNSEWKFKKIGTTCIDCHDDIHKGKISPRHASCVNCHNVNSWSTITFDHNLTDFVLSGRHIDVKCSDCHFKDRREYKFLSLNSGCENCHNDIHYGQFSNGKESECIRCHTFNNWKPEKFDHNKTKFPLTGAHLKIKCSDCHKTIITGSISFVNYKIKKFKCADCHS